MPDRSHGGPTWRGSSHSRRWVRSPSCRFIATANSSISASEMDFRKFSLASLTLILALVGSVGAFNRIIDPYGYFRDVEIAGVNADKTRAPGNERLVKPALMRRLAPQAMIVGSSFAEVGLPPMHPGFTRNGELS